MVEHIWDHQIWGIPPWGLCSPSPDWCNGPGLPQNWSSPGIEGCTKIGSVVSRETYNV